MSSQMCVILILPGAAGERHPYRVRWAIRNLDFVKAHYCRIIFLNLLLELRDRTSLPFIVQLQNNNHSFDLHDQCYTGFIFYSVQHPLPTRILIL